jgi:hypothetical protein
VRGRHPKGVRAASCVLPHPRPCRESLLLEAGWAGIWLAAQPGDGAGAPPALLLLRWQLFKACVLDGTSKLRVACGQADGLAECFKRVAASAPAPGLFGW